MKKLLVMTAVAAVVALVTSGTAQARHGHGGGGCCSMGCGYGGGFGGCGYGGGFGGCGYGGGFGGCGYGGGMMMGGCGFGGCGYGGGYGGMMTGGCGIGGCGYASGIGGFGGIGAYALAPAPASQEAVVVVALPEDAVLTVDDQATTSTSTERVFRTPDLEAGKDFHYTLKARYVQNGKEEQITRTITVRSGEVTRIDLNTPAAASTETAMAR